MILNSSVVWPTVTTSGSLGLTEGEKKFEEKPFARRAVAIFLIGHPCFDLRGFPFRAFARHGKPPARFRSFRSRRSFRW